MSKIANYLRGHLLGEIDFRPDVRQAYINDAGVLSLAPEMIVAPRNTDDIRKTARLSWQLAERGHVQAITARGSGRGTTGGAIGRGTIADMSRHMNNVFEYDAKQRLVRLQPGTTIGTLRQALSLQGVNIPPLDGLDARRTVGGAIADNLAGLASGKYGDLSAFISQLEIVLANGDILQTGPLGRRELSRKKGLQSLEGDIYRGIDTIIDEYQDVINALSEYDKSGYSAIASVKRGNQFDLTPLFIGAQGTLGIISEMILRTEFRSQSNEVLALVFASASVANDAMRILRDSGAAFAEYLMPALALVISKKSRRHSAAPRESNSFLAMTRPMTRCCQHLMLLAIPNCLTKTRLLHRICIAIFIFQLLVSMNLLKH